MGIITAATTGLTSIIVRLMSSGAPVVTQFMPTSNNRWEM
jgi:hypothetical protein